MTCHPYSERVARCAGLMKAAGLDVLLLAKPANMAYLTGDGRLCAPATRPRLFPWREGAAAAGDQCGYRRRELRPLYRPLGGARRGHCSGEAGWTADPDGFCP